jgi:hypothetical protein
MGKSVFMPFVLLVFHFVLMVDLGAVFLFR